MNLPAVALLFQTVMQGRTAAQEIEVIPTPSSGTEIRIVVFDAQQLVLREQIARLEKGMLVVDRVPQAAFLQAVGPRVFSERTPVRTDRKVQLRALSIGRAHVTGVPHIGGVRTRIFGALVRPFDGRTTTSWDVPEDAHGTSDGVSWCEVLLPAGHYALALDRGLAPPVLVATAEVATEREASVTAREVKGQRLRLRALDPMKKPVQGAFLDGVSFEASNRALETLLLRRTRASTADGVIDCGVVPSESALTFRVAAPTFRTATVKLTAHFEEQNREVYLVRNQNVEVRLAGFQERRADPRPVVGLARCRNQHMNGGCNPAATVESPLDRDGRARFLRVAGGLYRVAVHVPSLGASFQMVQVASDGDAESVIVDFAVIEWTLRGRTLLSDGTGLSAHIRATQLADGRSTGIAAETTSAPDGTFELRVAQQDGAKLLLNAQALDPAAVTRVPQLVSLGGDVRVRDDVVLELDATGLEIRVRDSHTDTPLTDCPVTITLASKSDSSNMSTTYNTDDSGIARVLGLSGGVVNVSANCKGHRQWNLQDVGLTPNDVKHLDVHIDPASDLTLNTVDDRGSPVAGATVLVLTDPPGWYIGIGRLGMVTRAGTTDATGILSLPGDVYSGKMFFVISAGARVSHGTLPAPTRCDDPRACTETVALHQPDPFFGLSIRRRSGLPTRAGIYTWFVDGVPLPFPVIATIIDVNGLTPDVETTLASVNAAQFLPNGAYEVRAAEAARNAGHQALLRVVGRFRLPAGQPIELVDADDEQATQNSGAP